MNFLKKVNIFVILRFILAMIFIVSGTEKLLSPVENFIFAIQSYDIVPFPELEELIALVFPWIELFVGVFLLLGLWTKLSLIGTAAMACGFIFFVGQGMFRRLSLIDCGCFGDLAHFPIWVTFILDWVILLVSAFLIIKLDQVKLFSLDQKID